MIIVFQCIDKQKEITGLTESNFLKYIRDYFILNEEETNFENFRNKVEFEYIRNKMKSIYGKLKDKYDGKNDFIERYFLRFFINSDYNYEETTELLDEYYKNKDNNNYQLNKQKKRLIFIF